MPKKRVSLQAKHLRQSRKRRVHNMSLKSAVKTAVSKARTAIASGPTEAQPMVRAASRALDKAATKGVLHPRAAARKKSRLARGLNKAAAPQASA